MVLFQILRIWCLSSSFASSMLPSVLMDREVLTKANSVALKFTEPSLFKGMFIETRRCSDPECVDQCAMNETKKKKIALVSLAKVIT